jgi:hypothetical protein
VRPAGALTRTVRTLRWVAAARDVRLTGLICPRNVPPVSGGTPNSTGRSCLPAGEPFWSTQDGPLPFVVGGKLLRWAVVGRSRPAVPGGPRRLLSRSVTVTASSAPWLCCSLLVLFATLGGTALLVVATRTAHADEVSLFVGAGLHEQKLSSSPLPFASASGLPFLPRPATPVSVVADPAAGTATNASVGTPSSDDAPATGGQGAARGPIPTRPRVTPTGSDRRPESGPSTDTAGMTENSADPGTNGRSGAHLRPGATTARTTTPPAGTAQPSARHGSASARGDAAAPPSDACSSASGGCSTGDPDTMLALPPHHITLGGTPSLPAVRHAPGGHVSAGSAQPETRPD